MFVDENWESSSDYDSSAVYLYSKIEESESKAEASTSNVSSIIDHKVIKELKLAEVAVSVADSVTQLSLASPLDQNPPNNTKEDLDLMLFNPISKETINIVHYVRVFLNRSWKNQTSWSWKMNPYCSSWWQQWWRQRSTFERVGGFQEH